MNDKHMGILFVFMFLTIFLIVTPMILADDLTNNYDDAQLNSFLDSNSWWWTNSYSNNRNIDFSKDFWMPIDSWEYEVCSRGLSSQLTNEDGAGIGGSGIYNTAITIAAYKYIPKNFTNETYLYEITWYFQPSVLDKGKYYTVNVTGNGVTKEIQSRTTAGQRSGDSKYVAFYSSINYTSVALYYDKSPHANTPIIAKEDMSR